MPETIERLRERGQSIWLDFIHRGMLDSGQLERYVREGWITGLTSNPTIFNRAISGSARYDDALREAAEEGAQNAYEAFVLIASDDLRRAADLFRGVYEQTGGADGYVSFEAPPGIEHDAEATVREAHRLREAVGRPNVMIKVPGTTAGVDALRELTAHGASVNVTLLFGVGVYERVATAYIEGLERRLEQGLPLGDVASVASFFVSRVDSKVDGWLPGGSELLGRAAVANARLAYRRFLDHFSGPRWERLAAAGARVQRPLWASTSTKNPAYSDVLYVDELVATDTVNTVPEPTLLALADHGSAEGGIDERAMEEARDVMERLGAAGIDVTRATDELLAEGLDSFAADFRSLLDCIDASISTLNDARSRSDGSGLGALATRVSRRLGTLSEEEVVRRLWAGDHTLWAESPREISDRLGWLSVDEAMRGRAAEIESFARQVADAGYRTAVLMGMGGSSLAPEVMATSFRGAPDGLDLIVLDTTDPQAIAAAADDLPAGRTLFIAASKSGTTVETRSQLEFFWERLEREARGQAGRHVIAITDAGSPLAVLARERGFRRVFENPPDIGGRYSALSYFGLLPAALAGVPVGTVLEGAASMRRACHTCVPAPNNPGAWLGAALGEAAAAGRDKLTLVLPEPIASLGSWIEQLLAESTGKGGRASSPSRASRWARPGTTATTGSSWQSASPTAPARHSTRCRLRATPSSGSRTRAPSSSAASSTAGSSPPPSPRTCSASTPSISQTCRRRRTARTPSLPARPSTSPRRAPRSCSRASSPAATSRSVPTCRARRRTTAGSRRPASRSAIASGSPQPSATARASCTRRGSCTREVPRAASSCSSSARTP